LLLTLLVGFSAVKPLDCAAKANVSALEDYEASKFEPIVVPETIPNFTVIDQRSAEEVFIRMKRKMMPPADYFREGFRRFVTHSAGKFDGVGRELQFIIRDFRIELNRTTGLSRGDKGEIISKISVAVVMITDNKPVEIDNYSSTSWSEIEQIRDGISTPDIQHVLDLNFYKLLKDIFSDQKFIDAINPTP
jgi:hypothetical protein